MNRVKWFVFGGASLLLVVSAGLLLSRDKPQPASTVNTSHFSDAATGLSLDYNSALAASSSLSATDTNDKILLRLTDKSGDAKPFLITVRYAKDLAKAATVTKQSLIDYLQGSAELNLPRKADYKLEATKRVTIDGREAISTTFTYTGNQATPTKQRLLIIPIDNDRAVYVALQAKTSDFDTLDQEVFTPLQTSLKL